MPEGERLSDQLEGWLRSEHAKTIGSLIDVFEEKSFAVLFVLLLALPALPLPTGGVTHVFEVIAMLLALELIVGRRRVWLPGSADCKSRFCLLPSCQSVYCTVRVVEAVTLLALAPIDVVPTP